MIDDDLAARLKVYLGTGGGFVGQLWSTMEAAVLLAMREARLGALYESIGILERYADLMRREYLKKEERSPVDEARMEQVEFIIGLLRAEADEVPK